jgi:hypothetical protein
MIALSGDRDTWYTSITSASENAIDVLAVRKPPPYDDGDLAQLPEELN